MKKISLQKETLRKLQDVALADIRGGRPEPISEDPECHEPVCGDADDYANGKR